MKLASVLCVVAIGCGTGESKGAAKCQSVVTQSEQRIAAHDRATDPSYAVTADGQAMANKVLIESCKRDGWSEKMVGCVEAAGDDDTMFKCFDNLTPDQATALRNALVEAIAKKHPAGL